MKRERAAQNTAAGILIGAFAGALVVLLFTPKKGSEIRKDISDTGVKATNYAKKLIDDTKEKIDDAKDKIDAAVEKRKIASEVAGTKS